MAIEQVDIEFFRGDDVPFYCSLTEEDADGVMQAVDVQGATVWFTAKTARGADTNDDDAVIQVKTTIADPDTDAENGEFTFKLTHTDTAVAAGKYWYDVQLVAKTTGDVTTLGYGKCTIYQDVTIEIA